jgi:enediyne polyketide synthase
MASKLRAIGGSYFRSGWSTIEAMSVPPIAVVGLGCRYPGARTPLELWENVLARRRQFRRFPERRLPLSEYHDPAPRAPDRTYATRASFIDGFEFDWVARRIPQRTFESTDVVHWLALEVALAALQDAGYTPETVPTERSAVLVGNSLTGEESRTWPMRLRWPFVRRALRASAAAKGLPEAFVKEFEAAMEEVYKSVFPPVTEDTLAGVLSNTIPGRICNFLDFQGGGYTVDGACASGMIAVATAAGGLAQGDLDFALAGGVDMSLDAIELVGFAKVGALTRDDMNVYDKRGSGFLPGEGCGFVALKRLEDARAAGDDVYAVIRGWGISSDGRGGVTAPRADSQSMMLLRAYERAGFSPHELVFVEGHGTATVAGDKAELEGIQLALAAHGDPPPRSVGMTSAKSLIGHTKAASGLLGLIKTVIAVNRRVVPPVAASREPNAVFARTAHALYPIRRGEVLDPSAPVRAGASAMGFGGINCHVALESGDPPFPKLEPALDERRLLASSQETELFVLAAESPEALLARVRELVPVAELASVAELLDLAAQVAREARGPVRAAVVAGSPEELAERLRALEALLAETPPAEGEVTAAGPDALAGHASGSPRVGFLFPGQGSQQLDMGRTLVERFSWAEALVDGVPSFRELVFRPLDRVPARAQVDEWREALAQTDAAQPAICLASLLWLERLRRLGVRPEAVGGHSLGELTAFHAAGAFDEEALLRLAAERGEAMAAPAGEAGTMAALRCGRERAEELAGRAAGYVVVANANAPEQTVVSGERAAVAEVVALAAAEEIDATELAVSNAFHSRLVAGAAERIGATSAVPETATVAVPVVTGIDGEEAPAGLALREHLARQIVSPVDFVALVEQLAARCDVLVEVGPGRVLSGLAGATLGTEGPPCLPVAGEPERDRDLNALLAALFVRGAELDWDALYDGRLVRPFVPATELRFFESPLEQPFAVELEQSAPLALGGGVAARLAAAAGLGESDVGAYLEQRGSFLAQVIRADLESGELVAQSHKVAPAPAAPDVAPPAAAASDAAGLLVALAAELTGFLAETIPLGARLLDDLNLDSIKAAELVARAADELGVAGELDPADFANATLAEVAQRLGGSREAPVADPLPVLVEVVVRHTGFPAETIRPELRLLDDLNLDSIKAAEVVVEAAGALGMGEEAGLDPAEFANATLAEVAAALAGAGGPRAASTAAAVDELAGRPSSVRAYVVEDVESEPADAAKLGAARALLLAEPEDALAAALADAFRARGADATVAPFEARALDGFTHVVAVLPAEPGLDGGTRAAIERLRAAATPPVSTEREPSATVAFVSAGASREPLARAFAASLHHERADLRVRVVEGTRDPERVLAELTTPAPFAIASYDAGGRRREPRPRPLESAALPARGSTLARGDVVLVTGGARGITAECALGLARATGATMALVGSSPEDRAASTLERFRAEELPARYYRCDVTDAGAIEALVARVREDLGPIAAVVHGAGANVPRRVEQTTAEDAAAEAAPKLVGALNLCRALETEPPRLVVGLSSVTAVTGMPGNAWYGFANEALEAVLRRFGERHPDTSTLAIAFGLWDEVGMAAHAGDQLARMGVATIPVANGVSRFVELVERDPGSDRVVVAARLRGLDTWNPEPPPLPAASRYLEQHVHVDPGVEVVVRANVSTERDPVLADHVHRGTVLFPTVLGLEAMAQAVAWVLGERELGPLRIESIRLERPIAVEPGGTTIEVRAEVLERETAEDPRRVRAAIGSEATGFAADHFSALFVLAAPEPATESVTLPERPLEVVPERDLYGALLFQGPAFRRLERVHSLDGSSCLFEVRAEAAAPEAYLLGDPFARDALLQSSQLLVPQSLCLPVEIGAIELHAPAREPGALLGHAVYEGRRDGHEHARIAALDADGGVRERIVGFRARILETRPENPTAEELADPGRRDSGILRRALAEHARALRVRTPEVALSHIEGLHGRTAEERRTLEQPLFEEVIARARANGDDAA